MKFKMPAVLLAGCLAGCGAGNGDAPRDAAGGGPGDPQAAPACVPDGAPVELTGSVGSADAKTYTVHPFRVASGTRRIEVAYQWMEQDPLANPVNSTTMDLGLWDADGYRSPDGFRGWSGDRQGRIDQGDEPVFIEAGAADRGYRPGPIEAGVWHIELGVGAASQQGATWQVEIRCLGGAASVERAADPVNPRHVANPNSGWYHGDFHMHGYHSNPAGADAFDMAEQARAAGLDVLFYTEYVVNAHWDEIGAAQRANPDLLYVPGREIITYFGHANTHGETRDVVDYRHGFEDVSLGVIQAEAVAAGALFQINHPTTFDFPLLDNLCRGCQFRLSNEIDLDQVHAVEVVTGPPIVDSGQLGIGGVPGSIENPFMDSAIDFWDQLLLAGHKVTAVSGSDSRGAEAPEQRPFSGYGASATALLVDELSQDGVRAAVRAGRALVKALGVVRSPQVELEAYAGEASVTYGGSLAQDAATVRLTITGGVGHTLTVIRNAEVTAQNIPVSSDPFVYEQPILRDPLTEGPLGTYWRFETVQLQDQRTGAANVRSSIGNPVFLTGPAP